MATYKGTGFDTTNIKFTKATTGDSVQFDSSVAIAEVLTVTGNASVGGNLTVTGTLIANDQEQLLVKDNFIDLNFGETSTSYTQ